MLDLEKLSVIRKKAGLTQTDLAKKVGITPSHYSNIESGRRGFSAETLSAILQVLGIKIGDIWDTRDSEDIPVLPTMNNGIVIEKTKMILPPTTDTYKLVIEQITGKSEIDPNLVLLIERWFSASKEKKDLIMNILNNQ
ncbi:MAG: helix-turn-helix domain-containing protein [Oscillospiraceae bacterium]|nr:helix-turn-helix domain-containing protein [Oscillospiraceae bacterium]